MDKSIALRLFKKILLKELFQRLVIVKRRLHMTDRDLSEGIGQSANWFSDAKKNMEDIRLTSFLRILSFLKKTKKPDDPISSIPSEIQIDEIFTDQVIWLSSVYIDLKDNLHTGNGHSIYKYLKGDPEKLKGLMATLNNLNEDKEKLSEEEIIILNDLFETINLEKERENI